MNELTPDEQNSLDEAWKAIRSPYQHTADEQNTLNWLAEYRKTMQENVRLVDDLRKLDEMWRDATDQSSRAIQALEAARAENATVDQRYRDFLRDWAETDTHVRNAAKTVLPAPVVEGNSYGVPTLEDVTDALVAENARLREALAQYANEDNWVHTWDGIYARSSEYSDQWNGDKPNGPDAARDALAPAPAPD